MPITTVIPTNNLASNIHEQMHVNSDAPAPKSAIAAAIIPAVASIIGTIVNNSVNRSNINAQNAYNSPSAQMKRLQAAGLNPYLMYGDSASAGNQSQPAVSQAADLSALSQLAPIIAAQPLQNAQIREIDQRIHESQTGERLTEAQTLGQTLANIWKQDSMPLDLKNLMTDIALKEANVEYTREKTITEWFKQDQMKASTDKIIKETGILDWEEKKIKKYVEEIQPLEVRKFAAEAGIAESELWKVQQYVDYYKAHPMEWESILRQDYYDATLSYQEQEKASIALLMLQYLTEKDLHYKRRFEYSVDADVEEAKYREGQYRYMNNDFGRFWNTIMGTGTGSQFTGSLLNGVLQAGSRWKVAKMRMGK